MSPDEDRFQSILIVAGMHRSGTSSVAGLYHLMGADIGRSVMPPADDNPKGFFENESIVFAHDQLLASLGRSWDMDIPLPEEWLAAPGTGIAFKKLCGILEFEFDPAQPVWMVKDPRVSLLLPLWTRIAKAMGRQIRVVTVLRHPEEVATSLLAREGMPFELGVALNLQYWTALGGHSLFTKSTGLLYQLLLNDKAGALKALCEAVPGLFPEPTPQQLAAAQEFLTDTLRRRKVAQARTQSGLLFENLIVNNEVVLPWPVMSSFFSKIAKLDPARDDNPETIVAHAYVNKLKLISASKNLELTDTRSDYFKLEQEHKEVENRLLERIRQVEGELNTLRQVNRTISEKATALEQLFTRNAQYPFRTSLKSFLWGSARLGYRTLPLSNRKKQQLLSRYGARLSRFMPGVATLGQNALPENIKPMSGTDLIEPDFSFQSEIRPDVSIIVPVYNQLGYTLRCLKSLAEHRSGCTFEVIVMDDVSNDQTPEVLARIPGLRIVRNEENLGFLRNCNKAAGLAQGEYLVFLNNDTVVMPGWLDALHGTFREHSNVGLVGSKLIYPDGRLQEAGGIVWNDASGWNWGRLNDPAHPRYNYVRDADYVSGASIMISRQLFEEIGRFDDRYAPAYYEDTDLAFTVREKGLRVIYQPRSAVIHFEGISSGTVLTTGIKRYQVVNKEKFLDKWKHVLANHGIVEDGPDRAADRSRQRHVLIIDATTPTPDQDSGSVDMLNLIRILSDLGRRVHFIPQTNYAHVGRYTDELQSAGVECVYFPPYRSLEHYIDENGHLFDTVFLCREPIAREAYPTIRQKLPNARIVFYTVDLHYLRTERQAALTALPRIAAEAAELKASELSLIRNCDMSILLSEFERDLIEKDCPGTTTAIVPLIRDIPGRSVNFAERKDVIFIGSFNHEPNTDAVQWLVAEIWPRVRERNVGARLKICGSNMPDSIRALCATAPDIDAVGYIADLGDVFNNCRLSIAPLRFGAGLKGKLATSFGYGVPCIATQIAVEGMSPEGLAACRLQGDTPEELAALVEKYYGSESDWETASCAGLSYVTKHFSYDVIKEKVADILADMDSRLVKV